VRISRILSIKMPGTVLCQLYDLWCERNQSDEYPGTFVNEYIARGGMALGMKSGSAYV
jgi:glucose-1-phosphate thymidylyltransferase